MATRHRLTRHNKLIASKGLGYGKKTAIAYQLMKEPVIYKVEIHSSGSISTTTCYDDTELEEAMAKFEPDFRKWQPPKE